LHKELSRLKSNYNNLYIDSILGSTIKDSVQDGVLIISPDLVIMEMNYSASLIFGYAKNEANGQPIENILIGPENLIPSLRKTSESGLGLDLGIVNLYRRNGQAFKAFLRINPIPNMQSVEKIIVVITDHSEQEALRVQSEQLEQSAYLGEISAIFAHEVRNPINNISTGLQLMAIQMETDNPLQAQIQRMQRDCARLTHLMDSGLSFSRPMDYNKTRLQLGKLLGKILDRWQPMMQQANIKSQLNIAPETPDAIGNARYLDQVFTNLVSNAIDAMENEGGNLTINIRPTEITSERDKVEVIISDTGPGIPDDVQEMIFKPFYTTRAKGTGLGLAIAKRIITAHKGSLHLSSVPGGTVFRVRLPIYDENTLISQGDI